MKTLFATLICGVSLSTFGQTFISPSFNVPFLANASATPVAGYTAFATVFDGSDWMERDADLTGVADGLTGSLSVWINFTGGNGVLQRVYTSASAFFQLVKQTDNTIRVQISGTDSNTKVRLDQDSGKVAALTDASGWTWIGVSWDNATAGGAARFYMANASTSWTVTEALEAGGTYDQDNVNLDYSRADHAIANGVSDTVEITGELCEVWFDFTRQIDWSSGTEQAKFIVAGKPQDLTGIYTPIMWFKSPYTSFTVNSGGGGDFVVKGGGALTEGTPP